MQNSTHWIGADPEKYPLFQETNASVFDHRKHLMPQMAVFRGRIVLERIPEDLVLTLSGDCKYRVFLNGVFLDDGPVEAGGDYGNGDHPDWWFLDRRKASELFHAGENVVVAEVLNVPEAQTDYSAGHTGFLLELHSGKTLIASSGPDWKCTVDPAYRNCNEYDQALSIGEYLRTDYDDSAWPHAVLLPDALSRNWNLYDLDLPPLQEETYLPSEVMLPFPEQSPWAEGLEEFICGKSPLTVKPGPPVELLLRFPEEIAGHIEFGIESAGGASVEISFMEIPGVVCNRAVYRTAPGKHVYRRSRTEAFRLVRLLVTCGSFPSSAYSPVRILFFRAYRRHFPLSECASFCCSSPGLEEVRTTIEKTMRLCLMRMHWDSPVHQEGLGCTGDYMIEAQISRALYGENRLARADIFRTAQMLRQHDGFLFHTTYSLLFAEMVKDEYFWSGDRAFLKEVFPAVRLVLERFRGYVGETGLVSRAPNYLFIDWICDGEINYHHPPAGRGMGCMTAFYIHALEIASELAGILGEEDVWAERAERAKQAFRRELWSEEHRCYLDGIPYLGSGGQEPWCPPEDGKISCSVHTNALALAYGIAEEEKRTALLRKVMTDKTLLQAQMYFMHFVFEAIRSCGAFAEYGFQAMEKWIPVVREHPDGLKECWNCGDYSHAWGGTPAFQLVHSVFGVRPLEPGWKTVEISPAFGPIRHAEGTVPLPQGTFLRIAYDGKTLHLALPENVQAVIRTEIPVIRETLS